ncbi:MAG TPA: hypothetical protein VFI99_03135 [Nocardioides sp.]|jgi:hypothetical protein|nr:hypothetical protein [Nocardioides sp.]
MSRMSAAAAGFRLAVALLVGAALASLMPSLGATVDSSSAAVLLGLVVATAAMVVFGRSVAMTPPGVVALRSPTVDEAPQVLAGRVTDPLHHPIRPRAPGLV